MRMSHRTDLYHDKGDRKTNAPDRGRPRSGASGFHDGMIRVYGAAFPAHCRYCAPADPDEGGQHDVALRGVAQRVARRAAVPRDVAQHVVPRDAVLRDEAEVLPAAAPAPGSVDQ